MAPNECTTNPSTSSAVCRACFLAHRARAPHLAACHWLVGWVALAALLAEASRSLIACCSIGWAALATRLAKASHSLTTCCCSTSWAALAARLAEASCSLTACCCSTG